MLVAWRSNRQLCRHFCSAHVGQSSPLLILCKIRSDKPKARENQDMTMKDNIRPSLLNYLLRFCHVSFAPELSGPTPISQLPSPSHFIFHPLQAQPEGFSLNTWRSPCLFSLNALDFPCHTSRDVIRVVSHTSQAADLAEGTEPRLCPAPAMPTVPPTCQWQQIHPCHPLPG